MKLHCHMQAGFPGIDKNTSGVTGFDPRIEAHRRLCHKILEDYLNVMATRIESGKEETFIEEGFQVLTTIDNR